jgi:hypothetical protein
LKSLRVKVCVYQIQSQPKPDETRPPASETTLTRDAGTPKNAIRLSAIDYQRHSAGQRREETTECGGLR